MLFPYCSSIQLESGQSIITVSVETMKCFTDSGRGRGAVLVYIQTREPTNMGAEQQSLELRQYLVGPLTMGKGYDSQLSDFLSSPYIGPGVGTAL